MAVFVFKKCKFPQIFCKIPAKTQFFEYHSTKRENNFQNLNYISFVTWAVTENSNFRLFGRSLAREKIEQPNLCF